MRYYFIIILYLLCFNKIQCQIHEIKYDTLIINKITPTKALENKVFNEVNLDFAKKLENADINIWQRFINWLTDLFFGDANHENKIATVRVFYWLVTIVGIIVVIWLLTKVQFTSYFKRNTKANTFNFTDIEEDITGINFIEKINSAISNNDLRLAIRWQYLKQLSILNEKNSIAWQPYKTNIDYSNELIKSNYYSGFKGISKIYDYTWYGEYVITIENYKTLEKQFVDFEILLNA